MLFFSIEFFENTMHFRRDYYIVYTTGNPLFDYFSRKDLATVFIIFVVLKCKYLRFFLFNYQIIFFLKSFSAF